MSTATSSDNVLFGQVLAEFKRSLTPHERSIFVHSNVEDVYGEIEKIQKEQDTRRTLRNLRKIEPYMKGLLQFSEVIGIFVQAKPEILSFIWGPVRFLLQVASAYPLAFDRLLDAFQAIGENLPRFEIYSKMFGDNIGMKNALVKFYKDILLFYQKALGFFRKKTWKILARCIWCPFESTFGTIFQDLSRHQKLIDDEASAAQVVASHKRDLLHNLEKWLQPADYAPHKFPLLGTGLWFVQNVDTQKWLDAGNTTSRWMWLTGNPGSGKTMLCVTLGNHIEKNMQNTGAIMSIFLKHGQGNASSFASVMRTLIHCILIKTPSALPFLEEQYHAIYPRPLDSADQFEQILRVVLDQYSRTIYLIIDGLDEIDNEERGSIISTLCRLRDIENLRVCFSSRSETDITDKLSHIYPVSIGSANDADIGTYITKEGEAVINQFKSSDYEGPEVECTIRDVLKKAKSKANGMFLLARLIIHELRACSTLEELEKAGDIMPSGLDEAYGRILERIHPDSPKKKLSDSEKSKACKILVWVICSFKPLKSDHIKKLLAIEVGNNHLDGRRKLIKRLEELCGPLLDLDKDGSVYIVHYSAKEYLTSPESRISASKNLGPLIGLENSHCYVATVCLTYLSFDCFSEGQTRDVDEMSQHICAGDYFFHEYAEVYWVEHVRHSIGADEQKRQQLYGTVQKFVTFQRDVRTALAFSFNKEHSQIRQSFPNDVYFAIMDYHLWNLTSEKALADAENNPWKLRGAIARIRQITENLLSSAVDPNDATTRSVLENMYGKAFFRCNFPYCKSYMEGFQTKEERDVHLNQHSRPFKCKISYCPYSTLGFPDDGALAQHIADKHVSDDEADMSQLLSTLTMEDNAISEAVVGSNRLDLLDIFRDAILSENASVVLACYNDVSFRRAVAEKGLSMLHYACAFDSRGVAIMLLDSGTPIDFMCTKRCHIDADGTVSLGVEIGDTPLHVAARFGHQAMTKILVDRGANVDAENHGKEIPLHIASSLGHQDVARILLEAQANILRLMGKLETPSTPQERGAEIRTLGGKLEVRRRTRLERTKPIDLLPQPQKQTQNIDQNSLYPIEADPTDNPSLRAQTPMTDMTLKLETGPPQTAQGAGNELKQRQQHVFEQLIHIYKEEQKNPDVRQPVDMSPQERDTMKSNLITPQFKSLIRRTDQLLPMFMLLGGDISSARDLIRQKTLLASQYHQNGEAKDAFTVTPAELMECRTTILKYFTLVKQEMAKMQQNDMEKARAFHSTLQQLSQRMGHHPTPVTRPEVPAAAPLSLDNLQRRAEQLAEQHRTQLAAKAGRMSPDGSPPIVIRPTLTVDDLRLPSNIRKRNVDELTPPSHYTGV